MNENYSRGFVDRCAAYGVDPEQLVKSAFNPVRAGARIGKAIRRTKVVPTLAALAGLGTIGSGYFSKPMSAIAAGWKSPKDMSMVSAEGLDASKKWPRTAEISRAASRVYDRLVSRDPSALKPKARSTSKFDPEADSSVDDFLNPE